MLSAPTPIANPQNTNQVDRQITEAWPGDQDDVRYAPMNWYNTLPCNGPSRPDPRTGESRKKLKEFTSLNTRIPKHK